MHMADALISPATAAVMYAVSTGAAVYSVKKIREEENPKKIPLMGVMGAFVFATQMVNFSIPLTGSSGHLCGGLLLAALLGPYGGFLTMIVILAMQALLFADGGILALGCNIWNMAFYACFFGYFCFYKPIVKNGFSKTKILIASVLGSVLSLQLGAFSVTLQTLASGITELPFSAFLAAMQPIHIAIGFVEGLITAAVLIFVYEAKPDIITENVGKEKISFKKVLAILSVVVLLIGGGLSLVASAEPDGLEWSVLQVTGTEEIDADGYIYELAADIQGKTAILPDYSFADSSNEVIGTSFSGIVGSFAVMCVCIALCTLFTFFSKRKRTRSNL